MISIHVDYRAALGMLTDMERKQLPYAMKLALNRVAIKAQVAEMEHMQKVYKLRRPEFVLKGVKIAKPDFATKSSWRVIISLAYPDDRQFLNPHEKGGAKVRHGGKRLWQPNEQVFKSKIINRGNPLHPKNLKLRLNASGRIQGEQGTFLVRTKGQVLILQRVARTLAKKGSAKLSTLTLDNFKGGQGPRMKAEKKALKRTGGTRLLYRLVSKVPIKATLQFVGTISKSAQANWPSEIQQAMAEAMKGAR